MQDLECLELLRLRDQRGIEVLLRHYGPLLRYVIAPILSDSQDQEEVLSEVAMRVWEHVESYDPERGSWIGWLTAVARNAALNRVRRKQRREEPLEMAEELPDREPSPEEQVLQQEQLRLIRSALQELPARERLLFYRKYYYLQSTAQIASELGLTERAVEGKLYRLKRKLRKRLGGDWDV